MGRAKHLKTTQLHVTPGTVYASKRVPMDNPTLLIGHQTGHPLEALGWYILLQMSRANAHTMIPASHMPEGPEEPTRSTFHSLPCLGLHLR